MTTALLLKIGAESAALRNDLNKANSIVNQFTSKIGAAGASIVGAFTVGAVANFTWEVSQLAAEAQGVKYAFDKIGGSTKLLHDLKEATHGTVSELELMKNAVAFKNFNLDIAQLPKLLEFATLRAQQTGQSVDYLVQSIVTGLGRKSVLILDNLGISSAALNAEIEKTGDFFGAVGTIVDREITNMGDHIENNITKTERLSASWTNMKVAIGEAANGTGVLGDAIDALSQTMDNLSSKDLTFWEKLNSLLSPTGAMTAGIIRYGKEQARLKEEQRRHNVTVEIATEAVKKYKGNLEEIIKAYKDIGGGQEVIAEATKMLTEQEVKKQSYIENEKNLTEKLTALQEQAAVATGKKNAAIRDEIRLIKEKIKALQDATLAEKTSNEAKVPDLKSINRDKTNPFSAGYSNLDSINASIGKLQVVGNQLDPVGQQFLDLSSVVQGSMANMAVGFLSSIGDMIGGVGGIEGLAASVVGALGAMAVQLGESMIQFGVAGIALKAFVKNPALAIAAGVALVALGKVLSNKATSIVSGGGGGGSSPKTVSRGQDFSQQSILIEGKLKIEGRDLVLAYDKNKKLENKRVA